jgi:hypothetical protein
MMIITTFYRIGWFYKKNIKDFDAGGNGCNPPWAIFGTSEKSIPGYCC